MPFTFLPHQLPVLPLKLAHPRAWSGTALVLGSMAPDLVYFAQGRSSSAMGHTLTGQLFVCLPTTIVLVWLVRRVIARPVAERIPDVGFFHLRDYAAVDDRTRWALGWRDVVGSLVGSGSHALLDSCTHAHGWVVDRVAPLRVTVFELGGAPVPVFKLLQHGGTFVGGMLTIGLLAWIGRRRLLRAWHPDAAPVTPATRGLLAFWAFVALGGLAGVAWSLAGLDGPTLRPIDVAVGVFLRGTSGAFVALVVGCVLARSRSFENEHEHEHEH